MVRNPLSLFILAAAVALLPSAASAISVSIDADPNTPGVQSFLAVDITDDFTVDVVIQDVVLPESVTAFAFMVGFDAELLAATDVRSGGYLPNGQTWITFEDGFGNLHIEYTHDPIGGSGDGVLASIDFASLGSGESGVDLTSLTLAHGMGHLDIDSVSGIDVVVGGPSAADGGGNSPVPEPTAAVLFAAGLFVVRRGIRPHRI